MSRRGPLSVFEIIDGARSDYEAAKMSRFRRRRGGIALSGSGADYHYRSEADYLRLMESARDMDRNDLLVGSLVDRTVDNVIQGGFDLEPDTGDEALNKDLWERMDHWMCDPRACSSDGQRTFRELERLAYRQSRVDGDIFALPLEEGQIQLIEAHRARTPNRTKHNVVHGIMLDRLRRHVEYWFTKDEIDPMRSNILVGEMIRVPALDADGEPNVFHVFDPRRVTQTRGVTSLVPAFDSLGMLEDINFAKLLQQQIASCFAIIYEQEDKPGVAPSPLGRTGILGPIRTETESDGTEQTIEDLRPGLKVRGAKGEKIKGFSPTIPNPGYFEQVRLILQLVAGTWGMPLVLFLLDASETNFSGWRGALQQAIIGFQREQQHYCRRFHKPIYRWKLRQFMAEDRVLRNRAQTLGRAFFAHSWHMPRWKSIQPLHDAQANTLRKADLQASPRQIAAEQGLDYETILRETVEDNSKAIESAIKASVRIETAHGVKVDWHELLHLASAQKLTGALMTVSEEGGGDKSNSKRKDKPDDGASDN